MSLETGRPVKGFVDIVWIKKKSLRPYTKDIDNGDGRARGPFRDLVTK